MNSFEDIIKCYTSLQASNFSTFHSLGKTYYIDETDYHGYYWYYETENFIIDIHDLYIKKEFIQKDLPPFTKDCIFFISNFVISGSGEWLNPYQVIEPFSMFIVDPFRDKNKYLLHKKSKLFLVGMKFKKNFLEKHLKKYSETVDDFSVTKLFLNSKNLIAGPISKIAKEIVTCNLSLDISENFFNEKAKEWLLITAEASENFKKEKPLSIEDEALIENVARYINDHYSSELSQSLLEKIACMSGTKLKETFKKKYRLSITEYIQRKRINVAEMLILNTNLQIKYISKTVGYKSASRFSSLYKRYKGIYPKAVKKYTDSH